MQWYVRRRLMHLTRYFFVRNKVKSTFLSKKELLEEEDCISILYRTTIYLHLTLSNLCRLHFWERVWIVILSRTQDYFLETFKLSFSSFLLHLKIDLWSTSKFHWMYDNSIIITISEILLHIQLKNCKHRNCKCKLQASLFFR